VRIQLSEERRRGLLRELQAHFLDHHGDEIGELKAGMLLEFFVERLAPPIYNEAIHAARKFIQKRLEELEGEFLLDGSDE
jgi:uncharacterized protein (DUF2164 family)